MGIMDKLKSATQAMTGGAAKVSIEYPLQAVFPGESMTVKVTLVSSGGEVKSQGVFVDLLAEEKVSGSENVTCMRCKNRFSAPVSETKKTFEQSFPIASAFVLAPGETKVIEANLQVPGGAQPSYSGPLGHHEWRIRGRLQAFERAIAPIDYCKTEAQIALDLAARLEGARAAAYDPVATRQAMAQTHGLREFTTEVHLPPAPPRVESDMELVEL